jgi:hypothetical protein
MSLSRHAKPLPPLRSLQLAGGRKEFSTAISLGPSRLAVECSCFSHEVSENVELDAQNGQALEHWSPLVPSRCTGWFAAGFVSRSVFPLQPVDLAFPTRASVDSAALRRSPKHTISLLEQGSFRPSGEEFRVHRRTWSHSHGRTSYLIHPETSPLDRSRSSHARRWLSELSQKMRLAIAVLAPNSILLHGRLAGLGHRGSALLRVSEADPP